MRALGLLKSRGLSSASTTQDVLGDPQRHAVARRLSIPGSGDQVLLLDPQAAGGGRSFRNLLRWREDGVILWHAPLPVNEHGGPYGDAVDCYTDVTMSYFEGSPCVQAFSWSCYSVAIEPNEGRLLSCTFTK
jgi:hypothetical protein